MTSSSATPKIAAIQSPIHKWHPAIHTHICPEIEQTDGRERKLRDFERCLETETQESNHTALATNADSN